MSAGASRLSSSSSPSPSTSPSFFSTPTDSDRFRSEEKLVHQLGTHNVFTQFFTNGASSLLVFIFHLISMETIFSVILSITLTILVYFRTDTNPTFNGSIMNWVLLSFAVVTPMSASIAMAFRRREQALRELSELRATLLEIYSAHASWDWLPSGRSSSPTNWLHHSDAALRHILGVGDDLARYLTLPCASRARHRVTHSGRREARRISRVGTKLIDSTILRLARLTLLCEALKAAGLPPNEASRIRQWERMLVVSIGSLRMAKHYRTPQALRSLCRLFSVFLPPFYAPFYATLGRQLRSLYMGVAFAAITALALTALFESLAQLEDPFVACLTLDGIDVHRELRFIIANHTLTRRAVFFPHASDFVRDILDPSTSICVEDVSDVEDAVQPSRLFRDGL